MAQLKCENCGYPYAVKNGNCPNCGVKNETPGCLSTIIGAVIFFGLISMCSDYRLKKDIRLVGKSPSGINKYQFKYNWSDKVYEGVLAQEVAISHPHAVETTAEGHLAVFYDFIDVEFIQVHPNNNPPQQTTV
jgi:hypothetical protein